MGTEHSSQYTKITTTGIIIYAGTAKPQRRGQFGSNINLSHSVPHWEIVLLRRLSNFNWDHKIPGRPANKLISKVDQSKSLHAIW